MNRQINGWIVEINRLIVRQIYGKIGIQINNRRIYRLINDWTNKQMDGWIDKKLIDKIWINR